jgi:Fe-S-cluster-containing hydrogenase component 2/CRP-like cAMP-binding protein
MHFEEETIFSRGADGRLIRAVKPTDRLFQSEISIVIDGRALRIKQAVAAVDHEGQLLLDANGNVVPRETTIFDAARALMDAVPNETMPTLEVTDPWDPQAGARTLPVFRPRENADGRIDPAQIAPNPIPYLCHQLHLNPVAVCRACMVEIAGPDKRNPGAMRIERKLLPACQYPVRDGMHVQTIERSEKAQRSVRTVVELLMADHPSPCAKESAREDDCELEALARRLARWELDASRFERGTSRRTARDDGSLLIAVDHDACILCDRCIRGCNDVKDNQVIGRARKGYQARIAFDLDLPMGQSSCVSCGECMISCPTGALTFRAPIKADLFKGLDPAARAVTAEELRNHPLPKIRRAFADVSLPFLRFNAEAIVRRDFAPGAALCHQGEYGTTASFIERGSAEVSWGHDAAVKETERAGGFLSRLLGMRGADSGSSSRGPAPPRTADAPAVLTAKRRRAILGPEDLLGEMACLNGTPRTATIVAGPEGCTVLEMQRNVLDLIRRSRKYRDDMNRTYGDRVVQLVLGAEPMFQGLDDAALEELVQEARYRRCEPGEIILSEGDSVDGVAETEGLFFIRIGFVKIQRRQAGGIGVMNYLGPNYFFGEMAPLSTLTPEDLLPADAHRQPDPELLAKVSEIRALAGDGRRTATCIAADHVELVQIPNDALRAVFRKLDAGARARLLDVALERLHQNIGTPGRQAESADPAKIAGSPALLGQFVAEGLMGAQSLLVLDLLKCTRCDECTKACHDTHGGVTRLLRDGIRFDRFLVATSCRSCQDPVCLHGCPVDSIHRVAGTNEIRIESHCIGCGQCATNCPYGNITMGPSGNPAVVRQAHTCDQCRSRGEDPNCVVACPHDAAHRMKGIELLADVAGGRSF